MGLALETLTGLTPIEISFVIFRTDSSTDGRLTGKYKSCLVGLVVGVEGLDGSLLLI